MTGAPAGPPQFGELHLVDLRGNVVKRLISTRLFGRIQHDGRWFASRRMKVSPIPDHVFMEESPALVPDHSGTRSNAGTICDMLVGPCACGATHHG